MLIAALLAHSISEAFMTDNCLYIINEDCSAGNYDSYSSVTEVIINNTGNQKIGNGSFTKFVKLSYLSINAKSVWFGSESIAINENLSVNIEVSELTPSDFPDIFGSRRVMKSLTITSPGNVNLGNRENFFHDVRINEITITCQSGSIYNDAFKNLKSNLVIINSDSLIYDITSRSFIGAEINEIRLRGNGSFDLSEDCFENSKLKTVNIFPSGQVILNSYAFQNSTIKELNLKGNFVQIGEYSFGN